jgi:mannose-6-phosphate isomerase-like protein (cupin superfamily)
VTVREKMRGGRGAVRVEQLWAPETELKSRTRLCARLVLAPGTSIGFHEHGAEEEVYVVLSGIGAITDETGSVPIGPGDTVLTGDGAGHAVACVGDEPLEMLAVIVQYGS